MNLLAYNVLGGGESHLYGTEGALFYFKNGFNNFNFSFILALLFLGVLPALRKKYASTGDLLVVVSPLYIWLVFMSIQPHKEERYTDWSLRCILLYDSMIILTKCCLVHDLDFSIRFTLLFALLRQLSLKVFRIFLRTNMQLMIPSLLRYFGIFGLNALKLVYLV